MIVKQLIKEKMINRNDILKKQNFNYYTINMEKRLTEEFL